MRSLAFAALAQHPWLGRVYRRLKAEELKLATDFLADKSQLSQGDFELAVNRMFLDRIRPKHWKEIQELLTCCNSIAQRGRRT